MRALPFLLLGLAACQSNTKYVVVAVQSDAPPPGIVQLKATITLGSMTAHLDVPTAPRAITLPSSFSFELPAGATGTVMVALQANNAGGQAVAWGSAVTTIGAGAATPLSVTISSDGGCPADVLLCDGFELLDFDPRNWNIFRYGFDLANDTTRPHRGTKSAHFSDRMGGRADMIPTAQKIAQPTTRTLWARSFVYMPSPRPSAYLRLFDISSGFELGVAQDRLTFLNSTQALHTVPSAAWTCIELEMDPPPGNVRVFVDGTEQTELMHPTPASVSFDFSVADYVSASPYEFFIDDVILDNKAVGCER
jgi:hypothetical protein